jgi:hypothetical protein
MDCRHSRARGNLPIVSRGPEIPAFAGVTPKERRDVSYSPVLVPGVDGKQGRGGEMDPRDKTEGMRMGVRNVIA